MILLLAFLFFVRQYGSSAAPVSAAFPQSSAAYNTTFFTREDPPDASAGRTVWNIAWSCLATTFAVTWVSVHPNVPFLEESSWHLLKRRIFLMFLALLAPEVMIMWAFKQWQGALMIMETINNAPRAKSSSIHWTMTHAHFLQMGGFKVNYQQGKRFRTPGLYTYGTTKKGLAVQECFLDFDKFRELLTKQLIDFPETTAKEIEDRSKSDALSKGVALLQISWFIIQLIARAHQHLDITEIELTTAALAGLNSIVYLFWWNKPFDVRCPIVIRTKELERRLVEVGRGREVGQNDDTDEQSGSSVDRQDKEGESNVDDSGSRTGKGETEIDEEGTLLLTNLEGGEDGWNPAGDEQSKELDEQQQQQQQQNPDSRNGGGRAGNAGEQARWSFDYRAEFDLTSHLMTRVKRRMVRVSNTIRSISTRSIGFLHQASFRPQALLSSAQGTTITPETSANSRLLEWIWTCCISAPTKLFYSPYLPMFIPIEAILDPYWSPALTSFTDAKDKMDTDSSLRLLFNRNDMRWVMGMMFHSERARADTTPLMAFSALAGAAFGSIHCAAWNSHFPSTVEQVLWRTASLTIVGVCLGIFAAIPLFNFVYRKWKRAPKNSTSDLVWAIPKKTMETVPAIVYPLARVSLLILSLLSLRDLSSSALDTVTWTKFIPHV